MKSIQNFDNALKDSAKMGGKADTTFNGLWKQIFAGLGVTWGVSKAIKSLTGFIKDSISAASEDERIERALGSAIETTGRNIQTLLPHFLKYSHALQEQTVYSRDDIQAVQTLLLQITKLDREGIDRATRGALALSTVFGIDLQSAARAVGNAFEGNFMQLGRYIPAIREAKDEGKKLAAMNEWLAKAFGRTKDETNTYAGSVKQLKNYWHELTAEIGKGVTENEVVTGAIKGLTKETKEHISWIQNLVAGWNLYWSSMKEIYENEQKYQKEHHEAIKGEIKDSSKLSENLQKIATAHKYGREMVLALTEAYKLLGKSTDETYGKIKKIELSKIYDWSVLDKFFDKYVMLKDEVVESLEVFKRAKETMDEYGKGISADEEDLKGFNDTIGESYDFTKAWGDYLYNWSMGDKTPEEIERINRGLMNQRLTLEAMESAWESAGSSMISVLTDWERIADESMGVLDIAGKAFVSFGETIIKMTEEIVIAELIETLKVIASEELKSIAYAISSVIKSLGFWGIPLAIGAAAMVSKLFSTLIPKKEKGGWVGLSGKEIIQVGEKGKEYILSTKIIENITKVIPRIEYLERFPEIIAPKAERGAYLPGPALIEAGHGRYGEVVLPLERAPLREIFRESITKELVGSMKITIQNFMKIGNIERYQEVTALVNEGFRRGDIKIRMQ